MADIGSPRDASSLVAVLEDFRARGFTVDFAVLDDGRLACGACRARSEPSSASMEGLRRVEGASDPADMAAVLGITCPSCGARGALVVRYGPEASAGEATLLRAVEDDRPR